MMLAIETAWNNPALDGLVWAVVVGGLAWWLLRRETRRVHRDPLADRGGHVRLVDDHNVDRRGCVRKVGTQVHAAMCVDDEGRIECVCGLSDLLERRLADDPFALVDDARLSAWADVHGETGGAA